MSGNTTLKRLAFHRIIRPWTNQLSYDIGCHNQKDRRNQNGNKQSKQHIIKYIAINIKLLVCETSAKLIKKNEIFTIIIKKENVKPEEYHPQKNGMVKQNALYHLYF